MTEENKETEESKERVGYMCRIAFDYELGEASGGNKIYPTINDLYKNHSMANECGIVKVLVRQLDVIVEGKI